MSCRCGCGLDHMDEQFMKMLQQLLNQLGPLPVTSGVRCEKHNHKSDGYRVFMKLPFDGSPPSERQRIFDLELKQTYNKKSLRHVISL